MNIGLRQGISVYNQQQYVMNQVFCHLTLIQWVNNELAYLFTIFKYVVQQSFSIDIEHQKMAE